MADILSAITAAVVAALVLTSCSAPARSENRAWAAGCARAEADDRVATLETSPYLGVTTSHDMIVAGRKRYGLGSQIAAATKAVERVTFPRHATSATSLAVVPFPPPLSREMRQVDADLNSFGTALVAYYRHHAAPPAIGDATQKLMRAVQSVRSTCARAAHGR